MGIGGNSRRAADAEVTVSIAFTSTVPEMAEFPRAKIRHELVSRITEAGDEFAGPYEVKVCDVRDDAAPGFTWKAFDPKARGWGFCHGRYNEDGVTYPERQYVLYPPTGVNLEALASELQPQKTNVYPLHRKATSRAKTVQLDVHGPDAYTKFMTAMAEAMATAGTNTPNFKLYNQVAMRALGLSSLPAAGKWVGKLLEQGLLMQVPDLPFYMRCYGFGPEAGKYLPPEKRGLAGTSLRAPQPSLPEPAAVSPESSLSNDELAKLLMRLDQVEQLEAKAKADALTIAAPKQQVETLTAQLANVDARVEQGVNAKLAAMLRAKL